MGFKEDTLNKGRLLIYILDVFFPVLGMQGNYGPMIPLEIKYIYIYIYICGKFFVYKIFVRLLKRKLYRYIT